MRLPSAPLRAGDLVRIRGDRWRVVRSTLYDHTAIVDVEGTGEGNRGASARFLLPFEPLDRLPASRVPRVASRHAWRSVVRRVLAGATPAWSSLRTATCARLSIVPFQLEPALTMIRGAACRVLIADEVGLGKTIQAGLIIAEVLTREPEARTLIVVPTGLREQWRSELEQRFSIDASTLDSAGIARAASALPPEVSPWVTSRTVITSIDYVKRLEVMRCLEGLVWDLLVLDEAHSLASQSDRSTAAAALATRARRVVLLTATPHSGDDDGFRRMCGIGDLEGDFPLTVFRRTRADAGVPRSRRSKILLVRPTGPELAMHAAVAAYVRSIAQHTRDAMPGGTLAAAVLMKRAFSSAASLARSVERRMSLLSGAEPSLVQLPLAFDDVGNDQEPVSVLGAPGLADRDAELRSLDTLFSLARSACEAQSKLTRVARFLTHADEPAIVFTEYRDTLEEAAAKPFALGAVQLHGGLTLRQRHDALRQFTEGRAPLLLATDAASEGLNLHQRCRLVVHLELPWTPLRLEQRAGRVDRIGQARRVHALHMVARNTGEESVLARLASRTWRAQAALRRVDAWGDEAQIATAAVGLGKCPLPDGENLPPAASNHLPATLLRADAEAEGACITVSRVLHAPSFGKTPNSATPNAQGTPNSEGIANTRASSSKADSPDVGSHETADSLGIGGCLGVGSFLGVGSRGVGSLSARPPLSILRQRSCKSPERLWAWRLTFTDSAGRVLWQPVLAVRSPGSRVARDAHSIRLALAVPDELEAVLVRHVETSQLPALQSALRPLQDLLVRRERAILASLHRSAGRLSPGLIQRGLFDRRADHAADAQLMLRDQAVARSMARLRELADWDNARLEEHELLFAAAIEP